ncbi:MAG: FKBP-type peptidyl-prolyl cis-trans isomerase [Alistipes sp.]|nr:FKBP-type peptidyl-prolyl cis-trans isomerase [Alistipes sp.]
MRTKRNIAFWVVALVATLFVVSCSNDTDTVLTSQQNSISKYLEGSHQPRLIPESEISSSLDNEPEYYEQWGLDLYRYIATRYAEGRDTKPTVDWDSTITISYSAYIFTGSKPAISSLYATNEEDKIEELKNLGLNTSYEWTTDPLEITIGESEILKGLEEALPECKEGDTVEIYMTFTKANGNNYVGMVPAKSAVVWIINILSVTNN